MTEQGLGPLARLLDSDRFLKLPLLFYRARLGWLLGRRLLMIEHVGRVSGRPRFVVVEVVEREGTAIRVIAGRGPRAQWLRNLRAHPSAHLSTGRARRVPAVARVLPEAEAEALRARFAAARPRAWRTLLRSMGPRGVTSLPAVEFTPPV